MTDEMEHQGTPAFPAVRDALVDRFGSRPSTVLVEETGTSAAGRWLCVWPDGRRFFVKAGLNHEHDHGVLTEGLVYEQVHGSFLPRLIATHRGQGDSPPLLGLEDLSAERWGGDADVRWEARQMQMALDEMESLPAPEGLSPMEDGPGWRALADDIPALCALGFADAAWWESALPTLIEAADAAEVTGQALVREEFGPEHWSWKQEGPVVVDWSTAAIGNSRASRALAEAEIRARGGPKGWLLGDDEPEWAAWAAARLLARWVAGDQAAGPAAESATEWAATRFGLPAPSPAR